MVSGNGAEFFPVQSVDSTTPSTLCTGTSGYSGLDPDIFMSPLYQISPISFPQRDFFGSSHLKSRVNLGINQDSPGPG